MSDTNIPAYQPRWWDKHQAQIEFEWSVLPAGRGVKSWLFDYEAVFTKTYKGNRVFWPRAWVRIVGIHIGAAIFITLGKADEQSPQ